VESQIILKIDHEYSSLPVFYLKPGFHYYANAERKRTQGLAY